MLHAYYTSELRAALRGVCFQALLDECARNLDPLELAHRDALVLLELLVRCEEMSARWETRPASVDAECPCQ